jgi:hypothetical protein
MIVFNIIVAVTDACNRSWRARDEKRAATSELHW